jgi:GNAT superfamily N-acetyltransferase
MRSPAFRLRRGTRRDVPVILGLIRGLAEYERLSHQVEATAARLRRHGFGQRRYFDTLLCWRDRQPVGFALYVFTYSTFLARPTLYLEDLFVIPEERGKGAGRALLAELARTAARRGCGRMEWAVLDWNAAAIRFYERLGAELKREWILTRLTGDVLQRLGARVRRRPRAGVRQPNSWTSGKATSRRPRPAPPRRREDLGS